MVQLFDHMIVNDYLQFFQIDQIAGCMCYFAFNSYEQVIIVPMPVRIGAFAKYLGIFLLAPFLAVHSVRSIKMLLPCHVYHHSNNWCKYTKQKQGLCSILAVK